MINEKTTGKNAKYLLLSFLMLSMLDAIITLYGLDIGLRELNGFMAFLINMGGFYFFAVKMFITFAICMLGLYYIENGTEIQNRYMYKTIQVITFGYICIVLNNLVWIIRYSI